MASINYSFDKTKDEFKKKVSGLKLPSKFPDSKVSFERKGESDPTRRRNDIVSDYTLIIPFEIDQKYFLLNEAKILLEVVDNQTKSEIGPLSPSYGKANANKLLKLNPDHVGNKNSKDFLIKVQREVQEIKIRNSNKKNVNAIVDTYMHRTYVDNAKLIKSLAEEINSKFTKKSIQIDLSDCLDYKVSGERNLISKNTDEQNFGTKLHFKIKTVGKGTMVDVDKDGAPSFKIPGRYEKFEDGNESRFSFKSIASNLYDQGLDPAQAFTGEESHIDMKGLMTGNSFSTKEPVTISKKLGMNTDLDVLQNIVYSTGYDDKPVNQLENYGNYALDTFGDSIASEIKTSANKIQYTVIPIKKSRRFKKINVKLNIDKSDLDHKGNIRLSIVQKNPKGLIVGSQYFSINVLFHLERYLLTQFNPEKVVVVTSNIKNTNKANLTIENFHDFDIVYKIFTKSITGLKSIDDDTFTEVKSGVARKNSSINTQIINNDASNTTLRASFGVAFNNKRINLDNVYSYSLKTQNTKKDPRSFTFAKLIQSDKSGVTEDLKNKGILVELIDENLEFHSVKFFRRDITHSNNSVYEELYDNVINNSVSFITAKSYFDNYNLLEGHVYEYIALVQTKKGYTYYTQPFREKFVAKTNTVNVYLEEASDALLEVREITRDVKTLYYALRVDRTFDDNNPFDTLTTQLKETGKFTEFEDDLKQINLASENLYTVDVEKLTVVNNTLAYKKIGNFKSGNIIKVSRESRGRTVPTIFKMTPYQKSPSQFIERINRLITSIDTEITSQNPDAIEQINALNKTKDTLAVIEKQKSKFSNRAFLKTGRLPPSNEFGSLSQKLSELERSNPTDDITYHSYEGIPTSLNLAVNSSSHYISNEGQVLLKIDVTYSGAYNVDFYILSVDREGILFPVSAIHGQNTHLTILDDTNLNYFGKLKYYIRPVYESCEIGENVYVRTVAMIDKKGL
tara:strand:- start:14769 stop:17660 length:2892 start_codon:yes stop_codon:yes gene_type:complete